VALAPAGSCCASGSLSHEGLGAWHTPSIFMISRAHL
jgi:hypothetical protein